MGIKKGRKPTPPEVFDEFLRLVAEHGTLTKAATAAQIHYGTIRTKMYTDAEFREKVAIAKEQFGDKLEDMVFTRAEKSDILLIFATKAHKPEYRDYYRADPVTKGIGNLNINIGFLAGMSIDDMHKILPSVNYTIDPEDDRVIKDEVIKELSDRQENK
ncbi:MAG: hypothetical protein DDT40_01074 [candidate division WS2 bacterium]|nr:hypothetical protein [Candidatus Psychracetigena formicireducens]